MTPRTAPKSRATSAASIAPKPTPPDPAAADKIKAALAAFADDLERILNPGLLCDGFNRLLGALRENYILVARLAESAKLPAVALPGGALKAPYSRLHPAPWHHVLCSMKQYGKLAQVDRKDGELVIVPTNIETALRAVVASLREATGNKATDESKCGTHREAAWFLVAGIPAARLESQRRTGKIRQSECDKVHGRWTYSVAAVMRENREDAAPLAEKLGTEAVRSNSPEPAQTR